MGSDNGATQLPAHLHELAESLQAPIYFMEILQEGGGRNVDACLVAKTAAQLRRSQASFGHGRKHLEDS